MLDSARAFHKQNALAVHVLSGRLPPLLSCSAPPGTPSGAKRTFTMHGSTELGILFALGTAFSWATAGIIHTAIARRVGVQGVMLLRQPVAAAALGAVCLFSGVPLLTSPHFLWLAAASGLTGILVGDACLYAGALRIGLRPAQVCLSLSAAFTAIIGAMFLGERIGLQGALGIGIATAGVILVVASERGDAHNPPADRRVRARGIALCLLSALMLAVGMIFSKQALSEGMDALSLALYRNGVSMIGIILVTALRGSIRPVFAAVREHPGVFRLVPPGCLFGPAGGIWLSCLAIDYLPASVASMLIGLEPIALLIIMGLMERRMPRRDSVIGAVIACAGAAVLVSR